MAEFSPKNLANGTLPSTKETLYTVPGASSAIIKSIIVTSAHTSDVTLNLYINCGTGSRRIAPKDMRLRPGDCGDQEVTITLSAGDLIEGDASVAAVVDYVINGIEAV